jgi:hypothetical protein
MECTEAEHQANRRTEFRIIGWSGKQVITAFDPDQLKAGQIMKVTDFPDNFFE